MKKMKVLFLHKQNTKKVFFLKNNALWSQKPFKITCAPILCKDKQMSCKKNRRNFETMQNTKFKQTQYKDMQPINLQSHFFECKNVSMSR